MKSMLRICFVGLIAMLTGLGVTPLSAQDVRTEQSLLEGWKFHLGSLAEASATGFDDRAWETVSLPHTWNAHDGQDGGGNYFRGDGWYRRRLRVEERLAGERTFLEFDAANRTADVYLNGKLVGTHRGGFARFRFDVTDRLRSGEENVLAVRVNNDPHDNMVPVSGDFTFCGGLYRGARLVVTRAVHIDLLDHASPGVYVWQRHVSAESAELETTVKLANDRGTNATSVVKVTVLDSDGKAVTSADRSVALLSGAREDCRFALKMLHPHLWDGLRDPYLYRFRTELWVDGALSDAVELPLGVRFFSVDPQTGFSLNGRYLDLRGVNRHQERRDKGWAISEADEREDLALIREMGANAVRQSHYQQSQSWTSLGDRQGMVMWAELAFVNDVKNDPEFFANAKEQLRELIRQNLQHPSIFFWSVGNETFVRDKKTAPPDTNDRLLKELADVAKTEDSTRLSTYASNGDVKERRASVTDVIGFNHYFGWYRGSLDDFAVWADAQHSARPELRMGMSEFGAGANVTQHEEPTHQPEARGQWHPEEWQAVYHEAYWKTMASRPWLWGKFIWCMFDFASDGRNEGGTPGVNDKGLVTADRKIRKDAFYWYQANWSDQPMLHITSRRFTPRTQPATTIKIYSNAENVEVRLNGNSLGSVRGSDHIFVWPDVQLQPGENRVTARAGLNGVELSDECVWIYTPVPPPNKSD